MGDFWNPGPPDKPQPYNPDQVVPVGKFWEPKPDPFPIAVAEPTVGPSRKAPDLIDLWANTVDQELVPRVLFVSNRHQMGKTNTMIRIAEKIQERVHGRKWCVDDLTLTCLEFMKRRKSVPEWTPLQLDEPERPIGNKSSFETEAQLFVEDLMTSPFRHIPAMFALPHSHFLNVSVWGVSTSLVVKLTKTHAQLYGMSRDMLNRSLDTYTPLVGSFTCEKAYAWDWLEYIKKRDEFDIKRGKVLEDRVAAIDGHGQEFDKEQVYQIVRGNPERFKDSRGKVSQSIIETELSVSQAKANFAAVKYNRQQVQLEQAEKQV